MPLDNDKTIGENGVGNNDTIQTLIATQAGKNRVQYAENYNHKKD